MDHKVVNDYTKGLSTGNDHIKVFVRARPPNDGVEAPGDMWTVNPKDNQGKLTIKDPSRHVGEHAFLFDNVLWCSSSQELVFQQVARPLVDHCLTGYNGCCFAYGQTGSGKTYSMFGETGAKRGIIPRCVDHIFAYAEREQRKNKHIAVKVEVSFLEMYCDEIRDLGRAYIEKEEFKLNKKMKTSEWYMEKLRSRSSFASSPPPELNAAFRDKTDEGLEIHEDYEGNVFVKDLTVIPVTKATEVLDIVERGFRLRATHGTKMNEHSSRSHAVFIIRVTQRNSAEKNTVSGVLNLVDLAGSERLDRSESEGQRMRETLFINSSLSALGKVTAALDPSTPSAYIPYRDSKLTRLLQNSLGGNAHTTVIATLNPARLNYDECLCTLQFANRCRFVVNQPRINYLEGSGKGVLQATIRRLQNQIRRLRFVMAVLMAKKNKQIADILRELGHGDAQVMNDGRVRLADGRILGKVIDVAAIEKQVSSALEAQEAASGGQAPGSSELGGLDGMGSFDLTKLDGSAFFNTLLGDGNLSPTDAGDGVFLDDDGEDEEETTQWDALGPAGAVLRGKMRRLRLKVQNERKERDYIEDRLKVLKNELRASETTRKGEGERYNKESRRLRDEVAALRKELINATSNAKSKMIMVRREYEARIDSLVQTTRDIQESTQEHLMRVPVALKVDSAKLEQARRQVAELSETLGQKHAHHIRTLLDANQVQISNIQQQAEYWIMQKDIECQRFVKDFNAYHRKRSQEAKELRRELDMLYDYANSLTRTFNKMQRGYYKIRVTSRQDLLQEIMVREEDMPKNPKLRFRQLKYQAQILRAFTQEEEKNARAIAGKSSSSSTEHYNNSNANNNSFSLKPQKNNIIPESIKSDVEEKVVEHRRKGEEAGTKEKAEVLKFMQPASAKPRLACSTNLGPANSLLDDVEFAGVRLDADIAGMDECDLRDLVNALREFTTSDLAQHIIEDKVLTRVSDHPTLTYIRTLEEGLETYKKSYDAEVAQHKTLRVAYDSLQRRQIRQEKRRTKQLTKR